MRRWTDPSAPFELVLSPPAPETPNMNLLRYGKVGLAGTTLGLSLISAASDVLLEERFHESELSQSWWVEGGQSVTIEEGRLRVRADPAERHAPGYVCTVWNETPIKGDVKIDFDAHVLSSSIKANNINAFFSYADPAGTPLRDSRTQRITADYSLYHKLDGYIFTFLNAGQNDPDDTRARIRLRRCPGFELLKETFDYHCQPGQTYHITITRRGDNLSMAIDGQVFIRATDPSPHLSGIFGLRTYHTDLWWDNLIITQLDPTTP